VKKILIIQTAFLGDVILATPVVSELNRIFPNSSIDFLVRKGNESLLKNNLKINSVLVFDKSNGKLKSINNLVKSIRKEKYDLVVNLHRFGSSGIIAGLSRGEKRYGFKKNPFSVLYTKTFDHKIGDGTHEVERNLSVISEFGAVNKLRPELFPSENDAATVSKYITSEYFCMAPASVWFTKQLPKQKWIELIQNVGNDKTIYLLGGPNDSSLCEEIKTQSGHTNILNLSGELSLLESAALMTKAEMNYVNDSGPLHLASAMNAKVTAFFCSTISDFGFGPLSDDSIIKEVSNLDCRPCGLHGHKECPQKHFNCGNKIDVSV
jgi:heptosyltransferase-2